MSLQFYRRILARPKQIGAIAPSSRYLARIITSEIGPETGPVIELGPGLGIFTETLLARGVAPQDLHPLELDPTFVETLQAKFPEVQIRNWSATRLGDLPKPEGGYGAVVSGLPLLSMGIYRQMRILAGAFAQLKPGGAFYQFTYYHVTPVPGRMVQRLGLETRNIGTTIRNAPPASVIKFTRKADRA